MTFIASYKWSIYDNTNSRKWYADWLQHSSTWWIYFKRNKARTKKHRIICATFKILRSHRFFIPLYFRFQQLLNQKHRPRHQIHLRSMFLATGMNKYGCQGFVDSNIFKPGKIAHANTFWVEKMLEKTSGTAWSNLKFMKKQRKVFDRTQKAHNSTLTNSAGIRSNSRKSWKQSNKHNLRNSTK